MNRWAPLVSLALALVLIDITARAQTGSACTLEMPSFATHAENIFNDHQEQDLGDALAEYLEKDLRIAKPPADDQLTRIGERLLATLPPTAVHYRFRVYDSGEVNGFSIAGGRVYISRKLIASVKDEDALAGVLAHEIGHLAAHQTAIGITYLFRVRLGVTSVGDRADIFAKVHLLMSTPPKSNEAEEHEQKAELVADQMALYAMVRAGYSAESFASFMNESMLNKGKTGNWFTDFFGVTHEASRRYRELLKLMGELPQGCKGRQPAVGDAFLKWQHALMEERVQLSAHGAAGDQPLKLDPPLRPSPWRIRFSPDGKLVLVQDEGSITVVQLNPYLVLFRIDAPDVDGAQFTPDSQNVVFSDSNLRVERWNVATGKRADVKELVVFDGCSQSQLMPDGKTLVCLKAEPEEDTPHVDLSLIDVDSGKPYFEKRKFAALDMFSPFLEFLVLGLEAQASSSFGDIQVSQGGRYLLVKIEGHVLAYDLQQRQPVSLGGKLKDLSEKRITFLGPDRIYVAESYPSKGTYKAQVLSFPDGKILSESQIGDHWFRGATNGLFLIVGPLKDYPVGIFDVQSSKFVAEWKLETIDMWEDRVAAESPNGGLFLGKLGSPDRVQIPLPLGPMPRPRVSQFSPDGKYLVVSLRSRSALWDLVTGKRLKLMRPIDSFWIDDQDRLFGQFPKYMDQEAVEYEMPLAQIAGKKLAAYDDKTGQFQNLEYKLSPVGNGKVPASHVKLEMKNMETQAVLWSRDFSPKRPACWPSDDSRLVLAWDLSNEAAQSEVRNSTRLQQEAGALKSRKRGLFIETVAPLTGATLEQVVLPEVDLTRGWNDERFARVSGDFVLVHGEHNNTAIYRLSTGAKVGEFFGESAASNPELGLIAAVNREDEVLLVDEHTGKELQRFTLGSPVLRARIVAGKDRMLLVLTADQVVHRIPLGN